MQIHSLPILTGLVTVYSLLSGVPLNAQIVPDHTLGSESSVVTPNVNIRGIPSDRIDGGAVRGGNLFHSFQEFNVDEGRGAYFSNPDHIINILTRVTGGNISEILGTLGVLGNANLFLINPNGIVFGPNARLDVGGSFFATTADGVLFENGFEFAASNPEAPPLLTINMPLGLNIRENPGTIVNQAIPVDSEGNFTGLEIPSGNSLVLLGGDINIDGGGIFVPGGRIELAGLSSAGTIGLNIDENNRLSLSFTDNITDANLTLSNDAKVTLGGTGGGDIVVRTNTLNATNGGNIIASTETVGDEVNIRVNANNINLSGVSTTNGLASGFLNFDDPEDGLGGVGNIFINTGTLSLTDGAVIVSNAVGVEDAGSINIQASESVSLIGSSEIRSSTVESQGSEIMINTPSLSLTEGASLFTVTQGQGNGGNINLETESFSLTENAGLLSRTSGQGNGGNINIQASEVVSIVNSEIDTTVSFEAPGQGGNVTISTANLQLLEGAELTSVTFGSGNAGDLTVTANLAEVIGIDLEGERSVISNQTISTGASGSVEINAETLSVRDGGQVLVRTLDSGNTENLTIRANQIEVIGTDIDGEESLISNQTISTGSSGSLTIDTETLLVQDGGEVFIGTLDSGNTGDLTIRANKIEVIGGDENSASRIQNTVNSGAIGQGGDLNIDTNHLLISDGAQVGGGTFSAGDAGDVFIRANDIELRGTLPNGDGSILSNSVQPDATGNGGRLTIETDRLTVREGSQVLANTESVGNAGELIIKASEIEVSGFSIREGDSIGSLLSTSTTAPTGGRGGSLTIETDRLIVRDGAQVLTNTFGSGDAGDLTIFAETIEVSGSSIDGQVPSSLSSSVGEDGTGQGGTVTINTEQLRMSNGGQISFRQKKPHTSKRSVSVG